MKIRCFLYLVVVSLLAACADVPPTNPIAGQSFSFHFFAADSADAAIKRVAHLFNTQGIVVHFDTDHTFRHQSGTTTTTGNWSLTGHTLRWGQGNVFSLSQEEDRLYLRDSLFVIELRPIPSVVAQ